MDNLLSGLRAAAEPTRLRLLSLCAQSDLTVTDLTQILGQSQPRLSRHLKVLCEAGVMSRTQEGTKAFFRATDGLAGTLVALLPADDPTLSLDASRLREIKRTRAEAASEYFRKNATGWDKVRCLHVDSRIVERELQESLPTGVVSDLLDIGTGTGRMLRLLGRRTKSAVGIDSSREMLTVARANLERAGLRHCRVRQADMYQLPWPVPSFDVVTIHMVLHYAERPAAVIAEAARVLRPGGRLLLVDFAPHNLEALRLEHAHRRLGFATDQITEWCQTAGLDLAHTVPLAGDPLTVCIWRASRRPEHHLAEAVL